MIIISIEGNIGSGKSTIINKLVEEYDGKVRGITEDVGNWNLLGPMYLQPKIFAFPFQMQVLISQYNTMKHIINNTTYETLNDDTIIVIERSPWSSYNVFVKMMVNDGILNKFEHDAYKKFYHYIMDSLYSGVFNTIYLKTSPDVCMKRISQRGRKEELNMSRTYIEKLNNYHEMVLSSSSSSSWSPNDSNNHKVYEIDGNGCNEDIMIQVFKVIDEFTS
ncbi:thymidine kinase [Trichoplusia ni ascovirus 2c]|uniref:thymidylate kinase n=1 Tax=Trichoplusia ni ascovirus 2c TaxID=328615 RepID=UPI0000E4426E|nr:thymidylate kinase [Trichoplusia ni ascovirus 2c]ABF70669.1 thymidine kinase [Trichoplusia ni ascovirus 2c]AUS94262.1 thymidine kinase [Trichoplusia ni ascovirus 6b]